MQGYNNIKSKYTLSMGQLNKPDHTNMMASTQYSTRFNATKTQASDAALLESGSATADLRGSYNLLQAIQTKNGVKSVMVKNFLQQNINIKKILRQEKERKVKEAAQR